MNATTANPLDLFHPLIQKWFREKIGTPTDIQAKTWPHIAGGEHVLVTAPTGSGKTLTAFLWAINHLLTRRDKDAHHRVLYISPLKALNNDIQRNLETPLAQLRDYFHAAGQPFPEIGTAVRSGDTEPAERRRTLRYPPEIFITTPESLNVLLASKSGRKMLSGISTVILDEIHAVAPHKRGTYLMTAVERLTTLSGEFQRIALSATVKPLDTVADFIGGYKAVPVGGDYQYEKRPVQIIRSDSRKEYRLSVNFPKKSENIKNGEEWWRALTGAFRDEMERNRSTLFFANSRRMVEKITRFINEGENGTRVYSHHGALSKEIRRVVEQRFKEGRLAGIIATSSLELGIDIGSVDEVVLIQAPYSIASAIQRIGRSGHGVGQVSVGRFYPIHSRDLIDMSVLAANIDGGAVETIRPVEAPLDVLAQILTGMTLHEERSINELYGQIRCAHPYHQLSRKEFDMVLEMLAGRYADSRIRELKPRVLVDKVKGTAKARDNSAMLIYMSGGVIPDRGYFNMRDVDTKAKIGELDEEFVWERSLGDAFPLGNQVWRIQNITHNDVDVKRVDKTNTLIPFWRAEDMNRSAHLSEKIGDFLEYAQANLHSPQYLDYLQSRHHLTHEAAVQLIQYLKNQREATGSPLPHRHHILVENYNDPVNTSDSKQTVLHTLWGGRVNRPFAFALSAAWEEKYGYTPDLFVNNDCILLNLPHEVTAHEVFNLVTPGKLTHYLRMRLESTGYFGARFRENAGRALLLPRQGFKERMPLWLNRLRSKKLLEAVSRYDDFPILLETWRTCMNQEFELEPLYHLLEELAAGEIAVTETVTHKPSPFTEGIVWRQTNQYMYDDDTPTSQFRTNLSDSLIKEVMMSSHLRPRFSESLLATFTQKVQRTAPGYSPASPEELLQWVRDRLYIPAGEWEQLLSAVARDQDMERLVWAQFVQPIRDRLVFVGSPGSPNSSDAEGDPSGGDFVAVLALENLPRVSRALGIMEAEARQTARAFGLQEVYDQDEDEVFTGFLHQWLGYYGPVTLRFLAGVLPVPPRRLREGLETLAEGDRIIMDRFREPVGDTEAPEEICDYGNLEILLRMRRAAERPTLEPLPVDALPLFIAHYQGLTHPGDTAEDLERVLETLFGSVLKAGLWESDVLPARLAPYYSSWLDNVLRDNHLVWFGAGKEKTGFCFDADVELFLAADGENGNGDAGKENGNTAEEEDIAVSQTVERLWELFDRTPGKLELTDIIAALSQTSSHLAVGGSPTPSVSGALVGQALWRMVWDGRVTNDDYKTLRQGVMNKFRGQKEAHHPPSAVSLHGHRHGDRRSGRHGFNRWKAARSFNGNWYPLPVPETENLDSLDRQELVKDRIRQLFMRYGVLFRELLWNEVPALRWARIFPVLRLMELSGEIVSGQFFKGVPGLQFCTPAVLGILKRGLPDDAVYWLNAADPASLCGIGLEQLKPLLPHRLAGTHLVFIGKALALVSRKNGKDLSIMLPPDHPRLLECFEFFKILVSRDFMPVKYINVETVNDTPVLKSDYREILRQFGFKKDYNAMVLMKEY